MEVRNLTEPDVEELEGKLTDMMEENPYITWDTFRQADDEEEDKPLRQQIDEIAEMIVRLEAKIDHIFGGHILINGKFVKVDSYEFLGGSKSEI